MRIELDGRQMTDRRAAHDYLQTQLHLPAYYGRNLDALYDLLTEQTAPLTIVLRFRAEMESYLGRYGENLLKTLQDAAAKNPALFFETD